MSSEHDEPERVVIRDKRRIDPLTGEARTPDPDRATTTTEVGAAQSELLAQLEERTADLQRVQAEYANYRKRMERELQVTEQRGVGRALLALLPVLDDWDRASEHGDVTGPIAAILEKEHRALDSLGLVVVGAEGDPFDPALHEAVLHDVSDEVSVPTATRVLRKGYRHGDRLLRAAMVGVTDPGASSEPEPLESPAEDMTE